MHTTARCTVYKFNGIGYDRFYIPSCHWQENKASNVLKSGMINVDSVTVYVPLESIAILPNHMMFPRTELFPNAENVPNSASKDMIVKGECNFIFNNKSQQNVSESMRKFSAKYNFHTVMSIDRKLYGSKHLQHIKLSAR